MNADRQAHRRGVAAIFVAALLFGVAGAVAKVLFRADVAPLDLTAVRTFVAVVAMGGMMAFLPRGAFRVAPGAWPWLVAAGVMFVLVNATFYLAIDLMSVAGAITLEYTSPFFVLVLTALTGKRRITLVETGIVAVSVLGAFLVAGGDGAWISLSPGLLVGLACGLSFAIFNMLGNVCKAKGIGATTLTFYALVVSTVVWLAALPFLTVHEMRPSGETVLSIGFIAVVATILPYWLLLYGLAHVDALPATVIGLLDPLAAGVVAYWLLGETLTTGNMLGIALVTMAVVLVTRAGAKATTGAV